MKFVSSTYKAASNKCLSNIDLPIFFNLVEYANNLHNKYASFIERRVQHDKVTAGDRKVIELELKTATEEIQTLEGQMELLAIVAGVHEWVPGLPRDLKLDPDVLGYCRQKFEVVYDKFNALRAELSKIVGVDYPEEKITELKLLHMEVQELGKVVHPLVDWNPRL